MVAKIEKSHQYTLQITWGLKNFVKIALSRINSEIKAFLRFTQKFKMAAMNGGKIFFKKSRQ